MIRSAIASTILLLTFSSPAKANERQIECIAQGIYFEARGEPQRGKEAVAHVILNRTEAKGFPNTPCDVVRQRNSRGCQFSWFCRPHVIKNKEAYEESKNIAARVYGRVADRITFGSTFFHGQQIRPNWKGLTQTVKIGKHIFYRK